MKGDYYRYIGEYRKGENDKGSVKDKALESYQEATKLAENDLKTTNPIRLRLALNFSKLYYKIKEEPYKYFVMAKNAFD